MTDAQPFDGIRVVEFGQFVAVPFCGQLLAEGGANVIKIESPEGDPNRHMGEIAPMESRIFMSRNRGKHSLPLRLNKTDAMPVITALLNWADVVLMNFRPGLAEQLGIDSATLTQKYPQLIIGEITPFGKRGADANLAAMDIVVQARSGLMAAMGRIVDGRPAPGDPVISDYMAATTLGFGIASALFRRQRTGKGGIVEVSLMQAAMTLANNQLVRSEDLDRERHLQIVATLDQQRKDGVSFEEQVAGIPSARALPLKMIYFRTFDTADGCIAIACASRNLQLKLMTALELTDEAHDPATSIEDADVYYLDLQHRIESLIRSKSSEHWVIELNNAGVPVSTVKFPVEMFEDSQAEANDMFSLSKHSTAGTIRTLSPPLKLDADGFLPRSPTAPFGSETVTLLSDLGFSSADIEKLVKSGITKLEGDNI